MQWGLGGNVNWTAPRKIALAIIPAIATCILFATAAAPLVATPRPGQEGDVIPVVFIMAFMFTGIHALHLWLVDRTLNGKGR